MRKPLTDLEIARLADALATPQKTIEVALQSILRPPHGNLTAYKDGCRCDLCRESYNAYHREYARRRAKKTPRLTIKDEQVRK